MPDTGIQKKEWRHSSAQTLESRLSVKTLYFNITLYMLTNLVLIKILDPSSQGTGMTPFVVS
ncbi:hypothetical protein [Wolbachia endosymbiont (group A) of Cheilosia soror]|uniref:hypothetical protein n=1 Tax=Wolbachia endosymbiont (group A) of Cheilosia soror TaxID=2953995 RepID=UPI0021F8D826|nr:hypothetical protein [Wolbachia endosymbiont (group A) of Cheilosia soror]